MGVVYQASDPDIGRSVAIKLVRADLLAGEDREQFLERFRHEARAAGRCTHPNIVALYDFSMYEGNPFLAMEYVDGVALGQALKRVGRFVPADAVAIVTQVLDALGAAHALGIVHRDIKPANVLVLPTGQVKVTDFGISHINTSDLTHHGSVIGSPAYMSPEQCRGESVDQRSDLFSAGTVLYELLSGTRAFNGRNATDVAHQLLTREPRDLTELVADVPTSLTQVLRQAMSKLKERRFASAPEMAEALQATMRVVPAAAPDDAETDGDAAASNQTTMLSTHAVFAPAPSDPVPVDDATLDTIGRRLALHVGPIARHMVREAAKRTQSIEALCETVARNIGQPAERERFLAETLDGSVLRSGSSGVRSGVARSGTSRSGGTGVPASSGESPSGGAPSAAQIERAERALTRALGPIAKLLVKRAVPNAATETVLWERLAAHIERPADRDAFLRQRTRD